MTNPIRPTVRMRFGPTSIARLLVLALGIAGCTTAPDTTPSPPLAERATVIGLVPDTASEAALISAGRAENYQVTQMRALPGLGLRMVSFKIAEGVTQDAAIEVLERHVPASKVGVNHTYRLQQSRAPNSQRTYADALMNWQDQPCSAQRKIGMIDTAIDANLSQFSATRIVQKDFSGDPAADRRHGTEVASVLVDATRLTNASLLVANVVRENGLAGANDLIEALDWFARNDVDLVNVALAGPYNKLLDLAVKRADTAGLLIVAAVGNTGPNEPPQFPAAFQEVLAVTAVDANRKLYRKAVRGDHVDFAAPGVDVLVPVGNAQRFVTGTSIATPFVTRRIAADPRLARVKDVSTLKQMLLASVEDLGPAGHDTGYGAGLLQASSLCGR